MPPMFSEQTLRCPATGRRCGATATALETDDGERRYPIVARRARADRRGAQPVPARRLPDPAPAPVPSRAGARCARRIAARLPTDSANVGTDRHVARCSSCCSPATGARACSSSAAARSARASAPLLDHPGLDVTETDVWIGPRTVIVCDGHDLPFARRELRRGRLPGRARARARPAARGRRDAPRARARRARCTSRSRSSSRCTRARSTSRATRTSGLRRLMRDFDELRGGRRPAGRRWRSRGRCATWPWRWPAARGARARLVAHLVPLATFWLPRLDRRLLDRPGRARRRVLDRRSSAAARDAAARRRRDRRRLPRRQLDAYRAAGERRAAPAHGTPSVAQPRRKPTPHATCIVASTSGSAAASAGGADRSSPRRRAADGGRVGGDAGARGAAQRPRRRRGGGRRQRPAPGGSTCERRRLSGWRRLVLTR